MKIKSLLIIPLASVVLLGCGPKQDDVFKITWCNYDGSVLDTNEVKRGEKPSYTKEEPKRDDTEELTFKFNGWTPEIEEATKNKTYTAVYKEIQRCDVTFKDYDGSILYSTISDIETIEEDKLVYEGKVPYKPNEGERYFYFEKWNKQETYTNRKSFIYTPSFKSCLKDDDQDYDGVPDYLDPTPLDSTYNSDLYYIHRGIEEGVSVNNAKFKLNINDMFLKDEADPNIFNKDIVTFASVLNCNEMTAAGAKTTIKDTIKPRFSFDNIYERIGFEKNNIKTLSLPKTYSVDEYDLSSVLVANKKVKDLKTGLFKDFIIMTIDINFNSKEGWISNLDIGADDESYFEKEGNNHDTNWLNNKDNLKGFYIASKRLYNKIIKPYLDDFNNPVVLLTGYSRGASIANNIGHFINNEYKKQVKLFDYTFGASNTYYGEEEKTINRNIFNIVNGDDLIPQMPIREWSDGDKKIYKHGIDKISNMSDYKDVYKERTSKDYYYFKDGIKIISDELTVHRNDIYKLQDSGFSKKFSSKTELNDELNKYVNMLTSLGFTGKEIKNYFNFTITEKRSSFILKSQNCLGTILKTAGKILSGNTLTDSDLLIELFDNYKSLAISIYLQGLTQIEQVSYPHFITTYYLLSLQS